MNRAIHRHPGPGRATRRRAGRTPLSIVAAAILALLAAGCGQPAQRATAAATGGASTAAPRATPAGPVAWSTVAAPGPAGSAASHLNAVACAGASDCWAVGSDEPAGSSAIQALIEQEDGGGWTPVAGSGPPGTASSELESVACAGAGGCWATGFSTDSTGAQHTLIERETAGVWTSVSSPSPSGGGDVRLDGVTCAGAADCWAVGFSDAAGTLIEQLKGGNWSSSASPTPPGGPGGVLSGVACAAAAGCWAVGNAYDASGRQAPLVEHDTGSGWTIVSSPAPNGSPESVLNAVTCSSDGCWAVGDTYDASGAEVPLIERNAGAGWSIVPSLTPSDSVFDTVTCAGGAGDCWAAGFSSTTPGGSTFQPLIEQYAQGAWSIVPSPGVPGVTDTELDGIACASATDCWAAGSSGDVTAPSGQTLLEQLQPTGA